LSGLKSKRQRNRIYLLRRRSDEVTESDQMAAGYEASQSTREAFCQQRMFLAVAQLRLATAVNRLEVRGWGSTIASPKTRISNYLSARKLLIP
jgi:hypothetical protein